MQGIPRQVQTTRRLETRGATLGIALAAGLAAALLAFLLVRGRLAHAALAPPVSVVVAAQDIPPRTRLTARMLVLRSLPPAAVPSGAVTEPSMLQGKVTTQALVMGSAVTADVVTAPSAALGLAFSLPPGRRAVSLATDPADGVDLFLRPGDHVDILATDTADSEEPNSGLAEARTVLQNVPLLAVGRQTSADASADASAASPPPASSAIGSEVTVAVTPAQAQILVLAAARGKLHFALRAAEDASTEFPVLPTVSETPSKTLTHARVSTASHAIMPQSQGTAVALLRPTSAAPTVAALTVTIIKGTERQIVSVSP